MWTDFFRCSGERCFGHLVASTSSWYAGSSSRSLIPLAAALTGVGGKGNGAVLMSSPAEGSSPASEFVLEELNVNSYRWAWASGDPTYHWKV